MDEHQSLSHTVWHCKYHVVFIPKCRRRTLYLELRKHLGEVFRKLAAQKEAKIEEGHLMPDHVHMMISIRTALTAMLRSDFAPAALENVFSAAFIAAVNIPNIATPHSRRYFMYASTASAR